MKNKNSISEKEIVDKLEGGKSLLPPLGLNLLQSGVELGSRYVDALLEVSWNQRFAMFAAEIRALSTPKALQTAMDQILAAELPTGTYPMIIVPYLKERDLRMFEAEKISAIDMCGNGVVICEEFMAFRSGQPNRYKSSSSIKNIYTRNSSMVARVLLCKQTYPSVQSVLEEVNSRNLLVKSYTTKPMSQSTVSKCLKSLDEDLIVARDQGIRLLQMDKLLNELVANYRPPEKHYVVSCSPEGGDSMQALEYAAKNASVPVMLSGKSSVNRYAVMQGSGVIQVYCPNVSRLVDQSNLVETKRFPKIELIEVPDELVFFDSRTDESGVWFTSPVQTYLELMSGDKRDIETAEQVKDYIRQELEDLP